MSDENYKKTICILSVINAVVSVMLLIKLIIKYYR